MENGKWKMAKGNDKFPIFHFPFPIFHWEMDPWYTYGSHVEQEVHDFR
jgi:hypothetical protein